MKFITISTLICSVAVFSSCASKSTTQQFFKEFDGPSIKQLGVKKTSITEVITRPIPSSAFSEKNGMDKWQASLRSKGLVQLGSSQYSKEGRTGIDEIRKTAASLGAKVVYVDNRYLGRGRKTISVPVAHTPGRTISSSSNSYGTINTNSSSYGSIGSTPYYGNSYGSGSYSGSTNSSTYIPGSTTYAAKQVGYSAYGFTAIFCVPESSLSPAGLQLLQKHRAERKQY